MIYVNTDQGKVDIFSTSINIENKNENSSRKPKSHNNYIICMTARSGSTMFCSLLEKTQLLGYPDEYLNSRGVIQMYLKKFPSHNIFDYFDRLRCHQVTPNGVFGMKTNYLDFKPLLENSLVGTLFAPVKFIYLERQDVVLQAVSSYMARKTGVWHLNNARSEGNYRQVEFDELQIIKLMDELILEKLEWESFFSLYSINPLRLSYEEILSDVNKTVKAFGDFLNVEIIEKIDLSMSKTKKIGDSNNQEFAKNIRKKYQL